MKILDEIDSLSQISVSEENGILNFMYEFTSRVTDFLNIERINVWLLNKSQNAIYSIAEYDKRTNKFSHNSWVFEKDVPHYFEHLKKDKIILAPNIHTHSATFELSDNYAKEFDVISLMDIPLRLNGKLIGVICFEKTGKTPREFNEMEQTFAIAVSQLVVSHIENLNRRKIQAQLEKALKEKEILIKELHHRVKNNFSVLVSLLRLSKENLNKENTEVFETFEHQVFSMLKVHELLIESENFKSINVSDYLKKLSDEFISSYVELKTHLNINIPNIQFEISARNSINLGLIITEIFLNSIKYCILPNKGTFELSVNKLSDNTLEIITGDSCSNFDFEKVYQQKQTLGLSIIKDLSESSDFEVSFPKPGNSKYKIKIHKS